LGAASSTSGGSSGSPVVNIKGEVIGLNAGGKISSASSYYLPLDRVVRAFKYIQKKEMVPRGTLQTIFRHQDFNELKRLGLKKNEELEARKLYTKDGLSGLLVVHQVVPGGTGEEAGLEAGDILLEIGGQLVHNFVQLEAALDDSAEKMLKAAGSGRGKVKLKVRRGDNLLDMSISVQDLHSVIPDQFIKLSGGVLHPLSYMLARRYNVPAGSVYIASPTLMFIQSGLPSGSIIKSVNAVDTPDIESFIKEVLKYKDGDKLLMKYVIMSSPSRVLVATVHFEGKFFPMLRAFRNDDDGLWHFEEIKTNFVKEKAAPSMEMKPLSGVALISEEADLDDRLSAAMVMVQFVAPHLMDGMKKMLHKGTGFIVDAKKGLVVCSRLVVPCSLGNAFLSIASEVQVPAEIVYIHPMLTFSVLRFNPLDPSITEAGIDLGEVRPAANSLKTQEKTTFVGLTGRETRIRIDDVTVTYVTRIPATEYWPPIYFPKNQLTYKVDKVSSSSSRGGLFVADDGSIQAFYWEYLESHFAAFPAYQVFKDINITLESMKANSSLELEYKTLGLSVTSKPISKIKDAYKVSAERLNAIKAKIKEKKLDRKHVLVVSRVMTSYPPAEVLQIGDIILGINNTPVVDVEDLEDQVMGKSEVTVTIQRDQMEKTVDVVTASLPIAGTSQFVYFSGLYIQPIFPHVAFSNFMPAEAENGGIFIVRKMKGSPADVSKIPNNVWITHVNDNPVKDLDAFLEVIQVLKNDEDTRIKIITKQGVSKAFTLKTDFWYFGTRLLERKIGTVEWSSQDISEFPK